MKQCMIHVINAVFLCIGMSLQTNPCTVLLISVSLLSGLSAILIARSYHHGKNSTVHQAVMDITVLWNCNYKITDILREKQIASLYSEAK